MYGEKVEMQGQYLLLDLVDSSKTETSLQRNINSHMNEWIHIEKFQMNK